MTKTINPKAQSAPSPMISLYTRLRQAGYDKKFVTERILPDWWDDAAAGTSAGYAHVVGMIADYTGLALTSFYETGSLRFETATQQPLYKLKQGTQTADVALASGLAGRIGKLCADAMPRSTDEALISEKARDFPDQAALAIRQQILDVGSKVVSFDALLDYCGGVGVAVVPVTDFPSGGHKMDAMAMRVPHEGKREWSGDRYVIFLCCNRKQKAWHLFHLAHELGHIVLGHLRGAELLFDEDIEDEGRDDQERAANVFAISLLTGSTAEVVTLPTNTTNPTALAQVAATRSSARKIDAGFLILCHARICAKSNPKFWGVATKALDAFKTQQKALEGIRERLQKWLDFDQLSDENAAFLQRITGINGMIA